MEGSSALPSLALLALSAIIALDVQPCPHPGGPLMSPADADRNLLFGALALQADLLDAPRFAEACAAWAARKDVPLAELLVTRGWITAQDRAVLDHLLGRRLEKHGGGARLTLA